MNRTIGLISANYTIPGYDTLSEERPVASMPFGGRFRLLDFPLSNMVNSRIQTVGLITPYFYRSIMDHVGAGKEWDLDRKQGGLYILPGAAYGFRDPSARFLFRDNVVTAYTILLRSYEATEESCSLLPVRQAAAAAAAMGRQGAELQVVYPDDGGDRISAVWTVREPR